MSRTAQDKRRIFFVSFALANADQAGHKEAYAILESNFHLRRMQKQQGLNTELPETTVLGVPDETNVWKLLDQIQNMFEGKPYTLSHLAVAEIAGDRWAAINVATRVARLSRSKSARK